MRYFIMKSEPSTYGIHHLQQCPNHTDFWEGVRNYQARNYMKNDMRPGDQAFFYHSNCELPGIVGTMTIVGEAVPDIHAQHPESRYYDPRSSTENPRWWMVPVQWTQTFDRTISLQELRQYPELSQLMILQKGSRLSITPITEAEWSFIQSLSK